MAKKKLLIYAHYYIPDTASTGQILRELAEGMLDKFDITVICVVPSYLGTIEDKYKTQKYYEEEINGVKVLRIRVPEFSKTNKKSRVKNIVSYFFGAMGATFKVGKMDYVFSISQPPILGGLLGVWGKWMKHAKYIYNIQDFNPEQVLAVGYTKSKLVTDAMMWFDKFSCKRSDLVITVGRDLVETVENRFRGKKVPKTVMINNWIDENEIYPLDENNERVVAFKKKYGLDGKFVIMYIRALSLSVLHCLFQATGQWLCAELIQPTPKSPKHRLFDRKALFLPLFRRKPLYFFFSCKELVTKVPPDLCRYRRITFRRHSLHELSSQMRPTAAACDMRDLVISGIAIGMVATGILLNRLFGFRFIFLLCLVKQTKLLFCRFRLLTGWGKLLFAQQSEQLVHIPNLIREQPDCFLELCDVSILFCTVGGLLCQKLCNSGVDLVHLCFLHFLSHYTGKRPPLAAFSEENFVLKFWASCCKNSP